MACPGSVGRQQTPLQSKKDLASRENPSRGWSRFPFFFPFEFWDHFIKLPKNRVCLFCPRRKHFIQNNPSRRSGHLVWVPSTPVELAGVEGLKTACVLGACQFCDSWHGRGWVGRGSLSPPNVSYLLIEAATHFWGGGLWELVQSLPTPVTFVCLQMFTLVDVQDAF